MMRTHYCGEIRAAHTGTAVSLCGWVRSVRDHKNVLFIDLYDREGHVQVLFRDSALAGCRKELDRISPESCVRVQGKVIARAADKKNPAISTGDVEVEATGIEILNVSKPLPFELHEGADCSEDLRLKYRYLDLRRADVKEAIMTKSLVFHAMRETLVGEGFVDIESPYMIKYTPGGARNFVVPSRNFHGKFFTLAESPQIFKQIFMVSGFDRYFQFARCFRDEDLRAERQHEFTQCDIEMSFIDENDILGLVERIMNHVCSKVFGKNITTPFARLDYAESMRKYGCDKPDLRYPAPLLDATEHFKLIKANIVQDLLAKGMSAVALKVHSSQEPSKKVIDALIKKAIELGSKGLIHLYCDGAKFTGALAKFITPDSLRPFAEGLGLASGDNVFAVISHRETACSIMGRLRVELLKTLGAKPEGEYAFAWVTGFPLFSKDDDDRIVASHHPFTSPRPEDLERLESDPLSVKARAYDLVLNGAEVAGGSIRIHDASVQSRVLRVLQVSEAEMADRFGFLLEAFGYGAPPHGGIAIGTDRLVAELLGLKSIREVIPFPKTSQGQCLMTQAPSTISERMLKELRIKVAD